MCHVSDHLDGSLCRPWVWTRVFLCVKKCVFVERATTKHELLSLVYDLIRLCHV